MKRQQVIKYFNQVRDVPYRIPLSIEEEDHCCSGKTKQLKALLEGLGYQVRFRVCSFKWSSMDIPEKVSSVAHEDLSTHSYLEVLIGDKWIVVDPTWDKGLSSIFSINDWDGENNTEIAVNPVEIFSEEESGKIMADEDTKTITEDLNKNGRFYEAFNSWLESMRR